MVSNSLSTNSGNYDTQEINKAILENIKANKGSHLELALPLAEKKYLGIRVAINPKGGFYIQMTDEASATAEEGLKALTNKKLKSNFSIEQETKDLQDLIKNIKNAKDGSPEKKLLIDFLVAHADRLAQVPEKEEKRTGADAEISAVLQALYKSGLVKVQNAVEKKIAEVWDPYGVNPINVDVENLRKIDDTLKEIKSKNSFETKGEDPNLQTSQEILSKMSTFKPNHNSLSLSNKEISTLSSAQSIILDKKESTIPGKLVGEELKTVIKALYIYRKALEQMSKAAVVDEFKKLSGNPKILETDVKDEFLYSSIRRLDLPQQLGGIRNLNDPNSVMNDSSKRKNSLSIQFSRDSFDVKDDSAEVYADVAELKEPKENKGSSSTKPTSTELDQAINKTPLLSQARQTNYVPINVEDEQLKDGLVDSDGKAIESKLELLNNTYKFDLKSVASDLSQEYRMESKAVVDRLAALLSALITGNSEEIAKAENSLFTHIANHAYPARHALGGSKNSLNSVAMLFHNGFETVNAQTKDSHPYNRFNNHKTFYKYFRGDSPGIELQTSPLLGNFQENTKIFTVLGRMTAENPNILRSNDLDKMTSEVRQIAAQLQLPGLIDTNKPFYKTTTIASDVFKVFARGIELHRNIQDGSYSIKYKSGETGAAARQLIEALDDNSKNSLSKRILNEAVIISKQEQDAKGSVDDIADIDPAGGNKSEKTDFAEIDESKFAKILHAEVEAIGNFITNYNEAKIDKILAQQESYFDKHEKLIAFDQLISKISDIRIFTKDPEQRFAPFTQAKTKIALDTFLPNLKAYIALMKTPKGREILGHDFKQDFEYKSKKHVDEILEQYGIKRK